MAVADPTTVDDTSPGQKSTAASLPGRRPLFRQEVIEFQQHNRQWGRVVPLQPLSTRLMVWCVAAAAVAVIAFLFFAQYARKETAAGYLAPVSGTARVFAPQPGTISAVYVGQGDSVEKGQPLLAVVTSQITTSGEDVNAAILNTLQQQKQALTYQIAEEVHRTASERQRLTAQIQEHESVLGQIDAQVAVQRERISILEKVVWAGAQLRAKGLVSEVDQRHREEALLEQRQALISLNQQSTQRRGQLSEVRFNLEQLPFTQGDKIQTLRNELSAAEQRIAEVNGRTAYIVRAPIGGRISLLQASPGQAADPRRLQLEILPNNSPLQAELFIPVRAIGFVEVGQDVRILFDAFPYQRFGTYHGRIVKVSQTVLLDSDVDGPIRLKEPAYTATVALDRPDVTAHGKKIPLQPDMSLRADIILEKRTLVDWIFAPLRHLRLEG
ncbi:MAG: HlyD family efflux transporter periplasmic adaptor subunit [Rhodopila sp.]|nr:HlyD family efflux transporter periplasmic adaptor subunit [Rhodopila sp.]